MKKLILSILVLFSVLNIVNAKSLVVFYSLTGTTKEFAQRISKESQSDIFELELENPYSTDRTKSREEINADIKNNIQRKLKSVPELSKYDTVFIGSPVWSKDLASPVKTWINLNQKELSQKTIIPFCTYWSTGEKEVLEKIKTLCNSQNTKKGVGQSHGEKTDVKKFLRKIGL